ncbi:GrpE nucleotide exchange factor [Purpureocillium lilacinum]|uniref:GrpE protein homolog n=1 Tax=Purpureocillium lilacinum TaxID=33203 RepID=A0A179GQ44_PURLI|nr:GrpE nucleotide exchange factor [Purpureocillium lilacinum]OAQ80056.1 GrpE nucleotide exchange factor [Purpureocillium lilacinum]OAQ88541.1 GrpE nucleotide exchange factor [Purpureocillium lilacinum]GJN84828.1 mitochondrial matrix cochaperone [Purpureocillium lilacinum]
MLRQVLSSSSRALRSAPRLAAGKPMLRPQFQSAMPSPLVARAAQPSVARWYSEAKEAPAEGEKDKPEAKEEAGEADALSELKKTLETKENEAKEWKDKCLRTVADFRNLQDRTAREVKTARDFAIQKFAKDLVESVDNLDRALTTVPADKLDAAVNQDLVNLYDGLKMTESILLQTLAKHGLERLDPDGEKFNPNEHEATFMAPQPDKENNTVFHIQQKGFKLNGRVLRAAKVGVVKNS